MTDLPVPSQPSHPRFTRDDSVSQHESMRNQALPAARPDLQISPQLYLGRTVFVVKDPVSLQYYRLQPPEHYILKHMDGINSAADLAHECSRRFPEEPTEADDVLSFVNMLHSTGLLLGVSGTQGAQLRELRAEQRKQKRFAVITNFLFMQIPVIDPDHLLDWMYRYAAKIMNGPMATIAMLYMAAAFIAAMLNLDRISTVSMPILSWQNLLIMSAVFLTVKVIHEFGHGLASKHRGLEVHELGVLMMVFIPMFYIDTTDAWMVPRRRDRLWIAAGGVFIEFVFAATAVWVWLWTQPGIVNLVALDIMISSSITTLLFNANPLLRYDGYYFLMDYLEIPNLKTKANEYLAYLAKRYLLAMDDEEPSTEAADKPIFMPLYAVASSIYRMMITFGIVILVWHILDPYGLEAIGSLLGMAAIGLMVGVPGYQIVKFLWTQQGQTWRRIGLTFAGAALLVLIGYGVWSIPIEQTVEQPSVALAENRMPVYIPVTGHVVELMAAPDRMLHAGDPILRVDNPQMTDKLKSLQIDRELAKVDVAVARRKGQLDSVTAGMSRISLLTEQIDYVQHKIDELTLRAPIDGRIYINGEMSALLGSYVKRGQKLGTMVGPGEREIYVVLPQDDASMIRPGMKALVRLWSQPSKTYHAVVDRVGTQFIHELPHEALSSAYKGEVDTRHDQQYKNVPATPSVLAKVTLVDNDDTAPGISAADAPHPGANPRARVVASGGVAGVGLFDGMTGRTKIITGDTTFGAQQWRLVRKALSLDWWL